MIKKEPGSKFYPYYTVENTREKEKSPQKQDI